jgi:hypothetical protein
MNGNTTSRSRGSLALLALGLLAMACVGARCESGKPENITIVLIEYTGAEGPVEADRLARELTAKGLKDVFVVAGPEVTSVCTGHFTSWKDPEADKTLHTVRQIRDASGQRPFAQVMLVPVPAAAARNEWPLEKAQGVYTLHVATWGLDMANRETAAQAYCATLRAKGVEAYVYHGPRFSMVTIGGFGPNIFDDPSKVGKPDVKPEVVDPQALDLIRKFPTMKLDGQDTVVPTSLVKIPGREPPSVVAPTSKAMYRLALKLVDMKTGLPLSRGEASGVAQARDELPALVRGEVQQILASLPKDKPARIGLVGVLPTDADAVKQQADRVVLDTLTTVFNQAAKEARPPLTVSPADATAQILDAAGLKSVDVLRDSRRAHGLAGLDYVVTGTVTVILAK